MLNEIGQKNRRSYSHVSVFSMLIVAIGQFHKQIMFIQDKLELLESAQNFKRIRPNNQMQLGETTHILSTV